METDIPLKVLAETRAADLLPLLGVAGAHVLRVRSIELPATAKRLDTLLSLRSPAGQRYRLLVEWQGYRDPLLLWRVLEYLARLGPQGADEEGPLLVVIIYVDKRADIGNRLVQVLDGAEVLPITFSCVRLWEQDAAAAVGSGLAGLAALSPLMGGATTELVEQAARLVLSATEPGKEQADLLSVLGILAEGLLAAPRFERLIGKERLMASSLMEYLYKDKLEEVAQVYAAERVAAQAALDAERAAERSAAQAALDAERAAAQAALDAERAAAQAALAQAWAAEHARATELAAATLLQAIQDMLAVRFPQTPVASVAPLSRVRDLDRLQVVFRAVLGATNQAEAEEALREP